MLRTFAAATLATFAAAPSVPDADYRHETAPDGSVLIVVAPEDLLRCNLTLAMVLAPLAGEGAGDAAEAAAPMAFCVAEESAAAS